MVGRRVTSTRRLLGLLLGVTVSACTSDRTGPEDRPTAPVPQFVIAPVSVSVTGGVAAGGQNVILTLTADANRLAPSTPGGVAAVGLHVRWTPLSDANGSWTYFWLSDAIFYDEVTGLQQSHEGCFEHGYHVYWPIDCAIPVPHSGTFVLTLSNVQGLVAPFTLKIHFSVVPCLAPEPQLGDSVINDASIRNLLRMALDSSPPTGNPTNRRERGAARLLYPDGTILDTLLPVKPTDSPCSFTFELQDLPPGVIPLLGAHAHPFMPGSSTDSLPYDRNVIPHSICPQYANKEPPPVGRVYSAAPGPSPADWKAMSGYIGLVVDKANVYIIEGVWPNQVGRIWKRSGTCDPIS
jgi:hypothetical protein